MRQTQRNFCCDVTVLCSAECWTDHKLLKAQLRLQASTKMSQKQSRKRYAVSALRSESIQARYNEAVREEVGAGWKNEAGGLQKWETIRDGLVMAVKKTIGYEKRKQPDWFKDNETTLQKHIDKCNLLFKKWLGTQHHSDRQRYVVYTEKTGGIRSEVSQERMVSGKSKRSGDRNDERGSWTRCMERHKRHSEGKKWYAASETKSD